MFKSTINFSLISLLCCNSGAFNVLYKNISSALYKGINNKKHVTGPIRYKEGDKYYHGVGKNETQKWNWKNKYNHHFFEYKMDHHLSHPDLWDTYNAHQFCSNCSYDEELSKNRRIMKIYKCNGHEI